MGGCWPRDMDHLTARRRPRLERHREGCRMSALRTPDDFERLGRVKTFKPAESKRTGRLVGITLDELDRKEFPPQRDIVEGVVPEGLTILGGRIKLGKSWMMYDISTAIGYGGCAFGSIPVEQ